MAPNYQPPTAWSCAQCGRQNAANQGVCPSCGGARSVPGTPGAAGARSRGAARRGRRILIFGVSAIFWLCFAAGFASPKACAMVGGPSALDEALETVRACNRAKEALGDDIGPALTGCTTGKSRTGGGTGSASWNTTIEGTKGKGSLSWSARKADGKWTVVRASLSVSGSSIDVLDCGGSKKKKKGDD